LHHAIGGRQATAKSKDKAVVAFAQDLVRDHEAVNKLKVTPEDNVASKTLSKQAADKLDFLLAEIKAKSATPLLG
jgi:putative membrane protein